MRDEPRFCSACGGKLKEVKRPKDGWSKLVKCQRKKCGRQYEIVYGDMQGGAEYCQVFEKNR